MKLAVLGTGLMGTAMAHRLLISRHQVAVYNRTKNKIEALKKLGALYCPKISEAIDFADLILLTLADINAIKEVLLKNRYTGRNVLRCWTFIPCLIRLGMISMVSKPPFFKGTSRH